MKKILNLVLAYVLIFNSVFASTITNNLNVGGDSNITGSSFISKILSIAGSFVTPDSKVEGSFENGTSQWVVSAGSSLTATSTDYADGSKSGSLSLLAGGTADLCTDMTKLSGRDIESSAEFKNSSTGLQICTLKNSVEATCNTITPDSYWKNWSSISKAIGSGQHCLRIKNPTAGTLTALVDSGKIGLGTTQAVNLVETQVTRQNWQATNSYSSNLILLASQVGGWSYKSGSGIYTDSVVSSHTRFNILKKALFTGSFSNMNTLDYRPIVYLNGSQVSSGTVSKATNAEAQVAFSFEVKAGDYVEFGSASPSSTYAELNITATAISENIQKTWEPSDRIGETIYLPQNVAPKGFISAMGSSIGKTSGTYQGDTYYNLYKVLWNVALNTAGQPYYISAAKGADALTDWNAGKTITIDESGLFTRAYKSGVSGNVGEKQADAFQGHWHQLYAEEKNGGGGGGSYRINVTQSITAGSNVKEPVTDGANGTPRTSNETRPVNVAKYVFIRYATSEPVVLALPTAVQTEYYIEAAGNAGQAITAEVTDIPFIATTQNNLTWDGSGFTASISGNYEIFGSVYYTTTPSNLVRLFVNNAHVKNLSTLTANGVTSTYYFSGKVYLTAGQRLSFRASGGGTLINDAKYHNLTITRLNGKNDSVAVGEAAKNQVAIVQYRGNGTRTTLSTTPVAMPLTTVKGDSTIVSIASNQFTLQAGEYEIDLDSYLSHADTQGWAYGYLYSISDSAEIDRTIAATGATIGDTSYSRLSVRLSIPSTKTYEVRFISSGTGTHYLGSTNTSPNDLNSFIKITKLNGN